MRGSGRQLDHAGLWVRNLLLPCCCGISLAFGLLRGSLGPQPKTWDSQGWDHCPAPASHPHLCHAVRKALCEARHRNMGNGDVPALSWLILCCSPVSIPPGVLCPPPLLALVSDRFCRDVQSSRFGDTGWAQLPWGVWGSGCIPLPGPAVGCQAWGSGLGGIGHQPASLQDASLLHHCCISHPAASLLHLAPCRSLGQGLVALPGLKQGQDASQTFYKGLGPISPPFLVAPCQFVSHRSLGALPTEAINQNLSRAALCEWMSYTSTSSSVIACEGWHSTHSCRIVPGNLSVCPHQSPITLQRMTRAGMLCPQRSQGTRHMDAGNSAPSFWAEAGKTGWAIHLAEGQAPFQVLKSAPANFEPQLGM